MGKNAIFFSIFSSPVSSIRVLFLCFTLVSGHCCSYSFFVVLLNSDTTNRRYHSECFRGLWLQCVSVYVDFIWNTCIRALLIYVHGELFSFMVFALGIR